MTAGVVGVAAVAATVAVMLSLLDTPAPTAALRTTAKGGVVTTTSMTTTVLGHDVTALVASVRPSLVTLEPMNAPTSQRATGVVLPGGNLVLTAASAVAGASQLEVLTADGRRHRGKVIGADQHSGVAVISTGGGGMVPATFADEDVEPSDLAVVACECTAASSAGRPAAGVGMVTQVGSGVALDGGPDLVNAIEAEMPLGPASWGGVMLDGHGRVIGILDGQTSTDGDTMGVFVPAPLAESVALELAQSHRVEHGWLGIVCTNAGTSGATVTGFLPGSPAAAAGLRVGDVVVAIDTHPVSSVADVQERLYAIPPGTTVELSVHRAGATAAVVPVRLSNEPAS